MNTTATISLDKRRTKADDTYPIVIRLSHKGKTINFSTGFSVPENCWNERKRIVKNTYKGFESVSRINNSLEKKKAKIIDIIEKLKDDEKILTLSIKQLKDRIIARDKKVKFFEYAQLLIDRMIEENRVGNARSYQNVLREVQKFRKFKDFPVNELNYDWLVEFKRYYLKAGKNKKAGSINGLAVYLRTIRAIINKCILEGLIDESIQPFKKFKIQTKPTQKRAITIESLQKIINLKYEHDSVLFFARNIFIASFYMYGAPFVDLAFLKLKNIKDGRIIYKRAKTGKYYDIVITEQLEEILQFYIKGKSDEDYIFPIVKRETPIQQYKDVEWARKRYNKRLRIIAEEAGIDEKLTSYVSRHSFASHANNLGIPLTAISSMLGHEKVATTQTYLAKLQREVIDGYAKEVFAGV